MHRIGRRVGVSPPMRRQVSIPVVVVGGVDGSPAFMVAGARGRSQCDPTAAGLIILV